jgi:hypothetical protein
LLRISFGFMPFDDAARRLRDASSRISVAVRARLDLAGGRQEEDIGRPDAVDGRDESDGDAVADLVDIGLEVFMTWMRPSTAPMMPMVGA